uniref:Uncharacterized protein n=1 Tax=Panagrellus redivivus TaxID=6233 RepID=A0A7E4WAL8_PANRE
MTNKKPIESEPSRLSWDALTKISFLELPYYLEGDNDTDRAIVPPRLLPKCELAEVDEITSPCARYDRFQSS